MKLDEWQTEADEDVTLPNAIAAFCVLALLVIVACSYLIVLTPR